MSRRDPVNILGDLSLLYELSLSMGHSLDLEENCERFVRTLMARKNLGLASVWIQGAALDLERADAYYLVYANPTFRVRERILPPDHPLALDLVETGQLTVSAADPAFAKYTSERGPGGGAIAAFRLGSIGMLKLHATTRADPLGAPEMRQLRGIVDKFAVSLEGCLSHRQAMREIERRRRAETALRRSEERYRAMFEYNPSMYFTLDADGRILEVNGFGASQLGWTPRDLEGRSVLEIFHREDRADVSRQLRRCLDRPNTMFEWRFRKVKRDGTTIWVQEYARAIQGIDGDQQVLVVCQDVTEKLAAERERQDMERQLQYSQKLESLGVLAGGIAHDFNNILTGVLGNAGLARMDLPESSSAARYVEQVEKAALRAAELCRQLLAYSGRGQFEVRPIDLAAEIRDAAELLDVSVARTITLARELEDELPAVEADPTQIRQLLMNLLTNASDAIGGKSGLIVLRTGASECSAEELADAVGGDEAEPGHYVFFEVEDTGCGMSRETVERIFDPFFTTKVTGRGLGLAAALGIVRAHSGAIRIRTREGEGTSFRVLLPASDSPATPRAVAPRIRGGQTGGTVLLVDDEDIVRQVGTRALERLGYAVLTARDGIEAIEVFRDRGPDIDVIILDLTMPRLDGVRTLQELRELGTDVPVVLSSGFDEEEASGRFHADEVAAFLRKPYPVEDLARAVREAIRSRVRTEKPA